ncbi:MAG: hypothetical protein ACREDQ_09435, partial [Limisphaerales bacterium]
HIAQGVDGFHAHLVTARNVLKMDQAHRKRGIGLMDGWIGGLLGGRIVPPNHLSNNPFIQ